MGTRGGEVKQQQQPLRISAGLAPQELLPMPALREHMGGRGAWEEPPREPGVPAIQGSQEASDGEKLGRKVIYIVNEGYGRSLTLIVQRRGKGNRN